MCVFIAVNRNGTRGVAVRMKGRVVILQVNSGDVIPGYAAGEKGELLEDSESSHWWMVVN